MNRAKTSITSLGLAVLFAACGSSGTGTPSPQGGSTGSSNGGAAGGGDGGATGSGSGGATGSGNGGATGSGNGGAAGSGAGGSGNGGAAGNGSGGGGGGSVAGGSTGAGGSQNGGATGAGGAGSGGATSTGPAVYTSTNGSCVSGTSTTWTPGTITTSTGNATVTVNDSSASQTWEGFGGAFNEKGWQYLQTLSQSDQDRAIQLLFGTDGANFAMGRIPMGSSDYAVTRYTCDEGSADTSMANFNTTEDEKYLIPYIKAALAVSQTSSSGPAPGHRPPG
jgi:glucosylceramidase